MCTPAYVHSHTYICTHAHTPYPDTHPQNEKPSWEVAAAVKTTGQWGAALGGPIPRVPV